jgi:cytochrome c
VLFFLLAGYQPCPESSSDTPDTEKPTDPQESQMSRVALSALALLALSLTVGSAQAAGNPEEGRKAFAKCRACHQLDAGKNAVGPSLAGLFGRKAGTAAGFKYSDAMVKSGVTWNDETIAKYMADPKGFIPGNKMVFPGIKRETEIADLIAYLKDATK